MTLAIGIFILWVAVMVGTGRVAYFYGVECGRQTERLSADRRVRGVLAREAKPRKTPKKKVKSSKTTIKVGEVEVPALVVKAKG